MNPLLWPPYQGSDVRKCSVKRFPYNIFFLDLDDEIWIAAIAYQKRKPGYWMHRQPG